MSSRLRLFDLASNWWGAIPELLHPLQTRIRTVWTRVATLVSGERVAETDGARRVLEPHSSSEALALLSVLARDGEPTDQLLDRILQLFDTFVPTEQQMRCYSLLQQQCTGSGGVDEFATATLFALAQTALMRHLPSRRCPVRSRSFP